MIALTATFLLLITSFGQFARSNVPDEWLHPQSTSEIQSCLSPELEEEERSTCRFYAAVVDAGSTGTRLHLFEFSHDPTENHSKFLLETETFKELKPGLSSFAATPELAAENVRELLLTANKAIPSGLSVHTPVAVKATAGLRLLPEGQADGILAHVGTEVARSGFLVDHYAVGMLSGTDEGVFAWFTLNFLTDRIKYIHRAGEKTAAALDLGGGSTQVTFLPKNYHAAMRGVPEANYSHTLLLFDDPVKLYTHSYLGNGLVAARLGIAQETEGSGKHSHVIYTHCLPKGFFLDDWDYAANIWVVRSTENPSFEACLASARHYVEYTTEIRRIPELAQKDIYVFSYFYDRAVQASIVPHSSEMAGGIAKVGDYKAAAMKACAVPAEAIGPEHWAPWQCLDLTYIYSLLHYGYGLPDSKEVHVTKKMRGMEVSWALGAAYHLLNSYHEDRVLKRQLAEAPQEPETGELFIKEDHREPLRTTHFAPLLELFAYLSDKTTHLLSSLNLIS